MRVAILSSYTIDFLIDKLSYFLTKEFGKSEIYTNQFNQYAQEILSEKSTLYSFFPDVCVFLFDDETWIKNQNHIFELILLAKKRLPTTNFLIGNLVSHYSPVIPSLEWNTKNSRAEQIAKINVNFATLCHTKKHIFIIDINDLIQVFGRSMMFDKRMEYLTKNPWSNKGLEVLSQRLTQKIATISGKRRKVLALDLDNTLWGGILGEDGIENILLSNDGIGKAYYDFQQSLLKLWESGILLVICSKNDEETTLEAIKSHPYMIIKKRHLAAWRINWNNKADNLISIAKELGLSLDSFILLDDSSYERKQVKSALPELEVPELPTDPSEYCEFLTNISSLDTTTLTREDKKRNTMYQHEQKRMSQKLSSNSIEKFLHSLHIKVQVKKATPFTIPRIAQLTQRTNQFNLTTNRYSESQIKKLASDNNNYILTVMAKDSIGNMGLIGVIIAKKTDSLLFIDTFLMSCRVLGRGIEDAALFALTEYANRLKIQKLIGKFIPTKKNMVAKNFFPNHYFISDGNGSYIYNLKEGKIKNPSWIILKYD